MPKTVFKVCKKCGYQKSINEYAHNKWSKDGHKHTCNACMGKILKRFNKNKRSKKEKLREKLNDKLQKKLKAVKKVKAAKTARAERVEESGVTEMAQEALQESQSSPSDSWCLTYVSSKSDRQYTFFTDELQLAKNRIYDISNRDFKDIRLWKNAGFKIKTEMLTTIEVEE